MNAEDAYEVRGELARDERGVILEAWDRRYGRRVAIKVLHDEAAGLAEVRVTQALQHPSIVPVYEAGRWVSGEPFYAMRLVEGRTLAVAAAETRERLALLPHLVAVAEALAYAHERGYQHRDLRAAHVRVGRFGETVVTGWGSGERGADTATDVHALGALVAEVLGDAAPPELRAVSAKAMDPARRYPSAAELAADLTAFTTGRVVSAMARSPLVRLRRWIGRNRGPVALAAALAIALGALLGGFVTRVVHERDRATDGRAASAALVDWLLGELRQRLEGVGLLDALAGLGGEVERYYGVLSPDADAPTLVRLASAAELVGHAESAAGHLDAALTRMDAARLLYERALARDPGDLEARRGLCATIGTTGDFELGRGRTAEAERAFRTAIDCLRDGIARHPSHAPLRRSIATVWWRLALAAEERGDWPKAKEYYLAGRAALDEGVRLGGKFLSDEAWLAQALGGLARRRGLLDEALGEGARSIAAYRLLIAERPGETPLVATLVSALYAQGRVSMDVGDWPAARASFDEAVGLAEGLHAREPQNVDWAYLLADAVSDQCDLALRIEAPSEAPCVRALELARRAAAAAPDQRAHVQLVVTAEWMMGRHALAAGDLPAARGHARSAREQADRLLALAPDSVPARRIRVMADSLLGEVELRAGHAPDAVRAFGDAVGGLEKILLETRSDRHLQGVAELLLELGDAQAATGDRAAAQASHQRARTIAVELTTRLPQSPALAHLVARTSLRGGDRAGALAALTRIDEARLEAAARRLLAELRRAP